MSVNQILGFAGGVGANTLPYAQYAALANLIAQGFQNGIADPAQFNTLMRQVSTVAAGLAQFTADNQSQDVIDDGVPVNFENKFSAALRSYLETQGIVWCPDVGSSDALSAYPAPAISSYKTPLIIAVQKNASVAGNQGSNPTINLNNLGNINIVKASGMPLYPGDLPQGATFILIYDGQAFRHVGVTLSTVDLRDQAGQAVAFASSGTNAYTGTLTPAPTALTPRMEVLGFFGTANTSAAAPTLLLNGIGAALPILKQGGGVPSAGDVAGILPLVLNTAGSAYVINGPVTSDILTLIAANTQHPLTGPTSLYVNASTGSDSNPGTQALPFVSVQKAIAYIYATYAPSQFLITVNVANGNYGGFAHSVPGYLISVVGNTGSPGSVVVASSAYCALVSNNANLNVAGISTTGTGSANGFVSNGGILTVGSVQCGTIGQAHMSASLGGRLTLNGNVAVTGGAQSFAVSAQNSDVILSGQTITLSNTPGFSVGFVSASGVAFLSAQGTAINGSGATGPRYSLSAGGFIYTAGGGPNFFPGNSAGVTDGTGTYN